MTDHPNDSDDPISKPLDPDVDDHIDDDYEDSVEALFISPVHARADRPRDPYDLGWLFVCWSWEAGNRSWMAVFVRSCRRCAALRKSD